MSYRPNKSYKKCTSEQARCVPCVSLKEAPQWFPSVASALHDRCSSGVESEDLKKETELLISLRAAAMNEPNAARS